MSDTPRTDKFMKTLRAESLDQDWRFVDLARTLERELAAMTKECEEQACLLGMSGSRETKLLAEIESLKKENARIKANHGCARQQRTTQFCAEAVAIAKERDDILRQWREREPQLRAAETDLSELQVAYSVLKRHADALAEALESVESLASWHCDTETDPNNTSPEDNVAHINGIIVQETRKALSAYRASQQPKQ
jgi:septal ring factor EnvC (AmiA/AmiB activator)